MDKAPVPAELRAILASLSREICRPLDSLRGGLGLFLDDPDCQVSDSERSQAQTMLALCDDLSRLTRDCLGDPNPAAPGIADGS